MSVYLEIKAIQRPGYIGDDDNNRARYSCNFSALAYGLFSDKMEEELAKILSNASLGTLNTDIFTSARKPLPTGDGPYIKIIDTGGLPPMEFHDESTNNEYSTFQVVVTGKPQSTVRVKSNAVWRALDGTRQTTVTV